MISKGFIASFGQVRKLISSQNHLIETASSSTGSLLIWDTGEYEMLPYREPIQRETDDELSPAADEDIDSSPGLTDSQKLHQAFQNVILPSPNPIQSLRPLTPPSAKSVSAFTAPTSPKTTPSPSASSPPKTATPNPPHHPESAAGKPPRLYLYPQQSAEHRLPLTSQTTMKSLPPIIPQHYPPQHQPSSAKLPNKKTSRSA